MIHFSSRLSSTSTHSATKPIILVNQARPHLSTSSQSFQNAYDDNGPHHTVGDGQNSTTPPPTLTKLPTTEKPKPPKHSPQTPSKKPKLPS